LEKAKGYFQQAIDKDPNYASAYVGLAEYYTVLSEITPTAMKDASPSIKSFVMRALAIDDAQPEAHALLGTYYDAIWEWDAAEMEFRRALELNPNNARSHVLYAIHLEYLGNLDQVLVHLRRAIELDPLNLNGQDNLGEAYLYTKEYDKSIEQLNKTLEIDPTFAGARFHLARAYFLAGKYDLWMEELERDARFLNDPNDMAVADAAKREYPKSGYRGALKRVVALREEQAKRIYIDPARIALVYASLGEKEQAFDWLEKAYGEKSDRLPYIKVDPAYDSLRSDPRYADLLHRMGLPQ